MTDPLADRARDSWASLVIVIGGCSLDGPTYCYEHGKTVRPPHRQCAIGLGLQEMSDNLSMLLLERLP